MARRAEDLITIENTRVLYPNFTGVEDRFTREGDRNFCVVLPEDVAELMERDGYNIKRTNVRDDEPEAIGTPYVKCKISFKVRAPRIYMVTSRKRNLLTEDLVGTLDSVEITNVDVILSPYNWESRGETGVTPYVRTMYATIFEDVLDLKYAHLDDNVD